MDLNGAKMESVSKGGVQPLTERSGSLVNPLSWSERIAYEHRAGVS
jgi:hypothetical protein